MNAAIVISGPAGDGEARELVSAAASVGALVHEVWHFGPGAKAFESFPAARLVTAPGGQEGIALALAEPPDVILLDIVMPGMDGYETCRRLKADEALRHIPVVFLTAVQTGRENRIRALEAGAEAFLAKPIDLLELTAQLRAMVRLKEAGVATEIVAVSAADGTVAAISWIAGQFSRMASFSAAKSASDMSRNGAWMPATSSTMCGKARRILAISALRSGRTALASRASASARLARRPRRAGVRPQRRDLDRVADVAEDAGDLAAQEDQCDDRDDRDQGEDQGVLGQALALLVMREERDECVQKRHGSGSPPSVPSPGGRRPRARRPRVVCPISGHVRGPER